MNLAIGIITVILVWIIVSKEAKRKLNRVKQETLWEREDFRDLKIELRKINKLLQEWRRINNQRCVQFASAKWKRTISLILKTAITFIASVASKSGELKLKTLVHSAKRSSTQSSTSTSKLIYMKNLKSKTKSRELMKRTCGLLMKIQMNCAMFVELMLILNFWWFVTFAISKLLIPTAAALERVYPMMIGFAIFAKV